MNSPHSMRLRLISLTRALLSLGLAALIGFAIVPCRAETPSAKQGTFFALATPTRMLMPIGSFVPGHGWRPYTAMYIPLEQGTAFTIYQNGETIAQTSTRQTFRNLPDQEPVDWAPAVAPWKASDIEFALAVRGTAPVKDDPVIPLRPDDESLRQRLAVFLKSQGLHVAVPFITQAFSLGLDDLGTRGTVVCAHSDASRVREREATDVYAVALVWIEGQDRPVALRSETSHKPESETLDEHQIHAGLRDFLRVVGMVDLDGDGGKELVLYVSKEGATQADVFSFRKKRFKKVLSVFKHAFL